MLESTGIAAQTAILQSARAAISFALNASYHDFSMSPFETGFLPEPRPGRKYTLYLHVPYCNQLCPYCFFNRYIFEEREARAYFESLRREIKLLAGLGYQFDSVYVGGGTPTVLIDELNRTLDAVCDVFEIQTISAETNPNHLEPELAGRLVGRVNRLSVGVQSFDDTILQQVRRYERFGSGMEILDHLQWAASRFPTLNVDMIFNFPDQTDAMLLRDVALARESGATQTTFHPLMLSPLTEVALTRAVGKADYRRELAAFRLVSSSLSADFKPVSAWTYARAAAETIDEYIVDYPEYVGLGAGSFSYLNGMLYVNASRVPDYVRTLAQGRMSVRLRHALARKDQMRYRFLTELFGLRLDKHGFAAEFGATVERGLWAEMAFLRASGAFASDNAAELTLTQDGRYLLMIMMREFFVRVNQVREKARAA